MKEKELMVAKKIKLEKETTGEWVSFDRKDYEDTVDGLVHFSAKAVNSNAKAGGVRGCDFVDLPYLSVSTLRDVVVGLDYTKNVKQTARISKQISAVEDGSVDTRFGLLTDEIKKRIDDEIEKINASNDINEKTKTEMIKASRKAIIEKSKLDPVSNDEKQLILDVVLKSQGKKKILVDDIDCHIKQIVMPDMCCGDIVLSPLHSAGFCAVINKVETNLLDEIDVLLNEVDLVSIKKLPRTNKVEMNFGGANPQNIGALVREMQRPFLCLPPQEDFDAKAVFSIHFKGIPAVTNKAIDGFLAVTDSQRERKDTMFDRIEKERVLRLLVKNSLERGKDAFDLLMENIELLPILDGETVFLDEKVDPVVAGLILSGKRNGEWRKKYSKHVVFMIMNRVRKMRDVNQIWADIGAGIDSEEAMRLMSLIEKEILS